MLPNKFSPSYPKKGFTMIELLIAVTIIAIIAGVGFINYSQSQVIARDAKRKQDLRSIQTALELYRQASTNKLYPSTGGTCCPATSALVSSASNPWITGLNSSYINSVPKDPKLDAGNPLTANNTGYAYWSGAVTAGVGSGCTNDIVGGKYYILAAGLENADDKDTDSKKNYSLCGTDIITYSSSNTFIVTSE